MRWYVSRNGETEGPVDEALVVEWIRAGMRDGSVRDEAGGNWMPLAASPFASLLLQGPPPPRTHTLPYKIGRNLRAKHVLILAVLTSVIIVGGAAIARLSSTEPATLTFDAAPVAEPDSGAERAEELAREAAKRMNVMASSRAMTKSQRENWVRQCVQKLHCKQWQIDAIIDGAPVAEQLWLKRVSFAAACEDIAHNAKDGTEASAVEIVSIAGATQRFGLPMLEEMPKTTLAEAKKDPEAARGKVMRVSGQIVEIRKQDAITEGGLMSDNLSVIHFVTTMSTREIYEGTYATFRGAFVQEYDYPNVSGGQTRSVLLSGAFELPENKAGTEPDPARDALTAKPRAQPAVATAVQPAIVNTITIGSPPPAANTARPFR